MGYCATARSHKMALVLPRSVLRSTPLMGSRCYSHAVLLFSILYFSLTHWFTSPITFGMLEAPPVRFDRPHWEKKQNQKNENSLYLANVLFLYILFRKHSVVESNHEFSEKAGLNISRSSPANSRNNKGGTIIAQSHKPRVR